ncbi:OLC1v1024627C1 [Oldenlandia corymbosa var. corymbosa]|uniref:OLC1v1024627C1 n=1 Tax=Oldenlandia corymbosa var. corymbosa TaxID=529605 RepID=A0AAV1C2Y0_OLDCO|nr:OLC1v1024627C1 [Oldenlandia corymbosa var. corymbosa]
MAFTQSFQNLHIFQVSNILNIITSNSIFSSLFNDDQLGPRQSTIYFSSFCIDFFKMENSNNGSFHDQFERCFQEWITQQHQDMEELRHAIMMVPNTDNNNNNSNKDDVDEAGPGTGADDQQLFRFLAEKGVQHFEEYIQKRALLAREYAPSFLCPSWCSCFEGSFLWIGGCRPSLAIRLVYSLCGSELGILIHNGDDNFDQLMAVPLSSSSSSSSVENRSGNLADISSGQLNLINSLHLKTIGEERKIAEKMASLQEEIADDPLAMIVKRASQVGESSRNVDEVLEGHSLALGHILLDADKLRLNTLKELFNILTPLQAANLLVTTKKLHLSMHEWGKERDQRKKEKGNGPNP